MSVFTYFIYGIFDAQRRNYLRCNRFLSIISDLKFLSPFHRVRSPVKVLFIAYLEFPRAPIYNSLGGTARILPII